MELPESWTDDMTIPLPTGVTAERIVDLVLSVAAAGVPPEEGIAELVSWGLPQGDAELVSDRALGGAFRAGTIDPSNAPSEDKDPIASVSYKRCRNEPALIAAIFPKQFPLSTAARGEKVRSWWKFWK